MLISHVEDARLWASKPENQRVRAGHATVARFWRKVHA